MLLAASAGYLCVTVWQTYQSAIANGAIEEVCVVRWTSAYTFDNTVESAIRKNRSRICACGVLEAYVQGAAATGWDYATVTLVGFRRRR